MGQKIVLSDVVFSDTNLAIIRDDQILSNGSLLLMDFGHSLGGVTGVPSTTVPNVAWKEAAAILGSGTSTTLAVTATQDGATVATKALTERTLKGGVHTILSLINQTDVNSISFFSPTAIRDYLYANRLTNSFYFSLWHTITRPGTYGVSPFHYGSGNGNNLFQSANGLPVAAGTNERSYPYTSDLLVTAGTNKFLNMNPSGISGTGPTNTQRVEAATGNVSSWATVGINKSSSRIIYRMYVEDLTVSGRTYAEVDAIDYALWQAAFAVGGKFYGDTYTAPSTLP